MNFGNPYFNSEEKAIKLLNSRHIQHRWKKDFIKNREYHEKWDLINSEGVKIEVKSMISEQKFGFNSISPNVPEQRNQIVLKLLHGNTGRIRKYKFVKFKKKKWIDITKEILVSRGNVKY